MYQGLIRNRFAFFLPIQRGFSGSIQTLVSILAHCEPFELSIPKQGGYSDKPFTIIPKVLSIQPISKKHAQV